MEPEQGAFPEILPPEDDDGHENGHAAPEHGGNGRIGGRARGTRNLKHRALERVARSQSIPIVQKLCEQALAGDTIAAKIILDRVWPRPRMAAIAFDLPATKSPTELRAAMHGLLADVAAGRIAPDEGEALVGIMRDVLESYKVQVYDAVGAIEIQSTNAREQLEKRLTRAIAERDKQADAETTSPD
jgi:hypothetical protein